MVGGAWGATTRMRSFSVHVRGCIIVLVVWAMEGQHGRPNTSDRQNACRCNGRSKGRPCPCPSVSGATRSRNAHWGRGRLVARHAAATRTRFLSIQRLSPRSASCWPCSHRWHARFAGKYWKRSPDAVRGCVDTQGPKKGWPGTPSSQWWKRRRLSSRKVIATCRRGGLSPAVSPLCSDAGSTAAGGRRMFAMKQLQCRPSAALHSCLCMPSHPATTPSNPSPEAKGEGVSLARGLAGPTGATGLPACSRINGNC